jgi:hypothetical protein
MKDWRAYADHADWLIENASVSTRGYEDDHDPHIGIVAQCLAAAQVNALLALAAAISESKATP